MLKSSVSYIFVQRYFPASGCRSASGGGELRNVGLGGYNWCASALAVGNVVGTFLSTYSGNVIPLGTAWRSDTFPVRCVQVFIFVINFIFVL